MAAGSPLLELPAELLDEVYHYVALNDRLAFADRTSRLPLLRTCRQLREEYATIFFAGDFVKMDAYYPETDSWCAVIDNAAKMDLFCRARFVDMAGKVNSRAGAQRHCQNVSECMTYVFWMPRHGIMTLSLHGAERYWMWTLK